MKKQCMVILAACAVCLADAQNWVEYKPAPQFERINSVYFVDGDKGYAVGDSGTLLSTLNGGNSWKAERVASSYQLNSIVFTTPSTGFIAGGGWMYTRGCLLRTTNAGLTWNTVPIGTIDPIYSSCFPVQDTGVVVGIFGSIYKTTNSGDLWQDHRSDSINFLLSVNFPSVSIGYAVGMDAGSLGGTILKTTDGGTTWNHVAWTSDRLFSVCFLGNDTGIAVGGHGSILKTEDGGDTWNLQTTDLSYPFCLFSVSFPSRTTGYAVGECGTILKSTDGGTTWKSQDAGSGSVKNLNSVYFTDVATGFAVGDAGLILRTKNGGDGLNEGKFLQGLKIYPTPAGEEVFIEIPGPDPKGSLLLLNLNGQEILTMPVSNLKTKLFTGNLQKGIYFVRFRSDQKLETGKLIKN